MTINNYEFRRQVSQFNLPNVRRFFNGEEIISFLGPKIWNIVSNKIKEETSLDAFRKLTKDGNLKAVHVDYVNNT